MISNNTLSDVAKILEERKTAKADSSYVASLYSKGLDAILKKVGEEATEVVMAAKDAEYYSAENKANIGKNPEKSSDKIVYEVADLWFHTLVLLAQQNLHPDDVLKELERRFGTSGLVEKASRKK